MTFLAAPARTMPQTRLAPARGSSRRDSDAGQLGDELAEGEGEVLGQVRARGVAAAAGEPHRERVGGAGDRPHAQADLADVDGRGRSAGAKTCPRLRGRRGDQLERAAGHGLLGRLEQQPDPAGEQAARVGLGQREPAPTQRGGVDVVAAGVGDARARCSPRVVA